MKFSMVPCTKQHTKHIPTKITHKTNTNTGSNMKFVNKLVVLRKPTQEDLKIRAKMDCLWVEMKGITVLCFIF